MPSSYKDSDTTRTETDPVEGISFIKDNLTLPSQFFRDDFFEQAMFDYVNLYEVSSIFDAIILKSSEFKPWNYPRLIRKIRN